MTLFSIPSNAGFFVPPVTHKTVAELGELLKEYIRRSGKTQRKLSEEAGMPNPSYLSHMANGRVNWVESDYFRPLADALGLKKEEIAEVKPDVIWSDPQAVISQRGPIPPVVDPIDLPLDIPAELQAMIDEHRDRYPELGNETTLRALVAPRLFAGHNQGPQTADQWLEYFLMNRRWLPQ